MSASTNASKLLPKSALILTDYAKTLLASPQAGDLTKATELLEHSSTLDNTNVNTWHLLAIAYGKAKQQGQYYLASAQESMLTDNMPDAIRFADLALKESSLSREGRLRANDLKLEAQKNKEDKKQQKDTSERTD